MKFLNYFLVFSIFVLAGCSSQSITVSQKELPPVYADINGTYQKKPDMTISLFRLNNYTDTPRAGLRAANLVEGLLKAKGYIVINHLDDKTPSFKKAKKIAKKDGSKYFMYGVVSEWRYKTGIDGEPAVSLQLGLYKTKKGKLVWEATGSDSDWGNGSIGTTAHDLLLEMMFPYD